jgi:hypothetical protein
MSCSSQLEILFDNTIAPRLVGALRALETTFRIFEIALRLKLPKVSGSLSLATYDSREISSSDEHGL